MTRERWNAMTPEEQKAWQKRKDRITEIAVPVVVTIAMHIVLHWLGWTP